jgi:nucleotide-binding universal stress UspA family protein
MPGIIVGIDGSGQSRHALRWALTEAAVRQAGVTVITVHEAVTGHWGAPISYPQDQLLTQQSRAAAQEETGKVLAGLGEARPASITVLAVSGSPAAEILAAARDADMIVVGSRGAGGFPRLDLGSVSRQVAHRARCPVVVVP